MVLHTTTVNQRRWRTFSKDSAISLRTVISPVLEAWEPVLKAWECINWCIQADPHRTSANLLKAKWMLEAKWEGVSPYIAHTPGSRLAWRINWTTNPLGHQAPWWLLKDEVLIGIMYPGMYVEPLDVDRGTCVVPCRCVSLGALWVLLIARESSHDWRYHVKLLGRGAAHPDSRDMLTA